MKKRHTRLAWYRRGWICVTAGAAVVIVIGIGAAFLWPRTPAYAQYADGVRPTVVFVWSDPSPSHPHV